MTAAEVMPRPKAITASVWIDAVGRTLTVRLPDQAGGYESAAWRQAWSALRQAYAAGWPLGGAPWISYGGIHSVPVDGGALSFTWPIGSPGFAELVARPGLYAIAVVDVNTMRFAAVRFLHRSG